MNQKDYRHRCNLHANFDLSNYLEQNKPTNDPMNNIYKGTDCYAPKRSNSKICW